MLTRALGKALGRRWRCLVQRCCPAAQVMVVLAFWTLGSAVAAEPGPSARPLPAFHDMQQSSLRKQRFFEYLTPVVRAENERIRRHRSRLLDIASRQRAGEQLGWLQLSYLGWLAREYALDAATASSGQLIDRLLERVDVIPLSLVLAQAAKESGWGCSRFARRGNNLFGQWCYRPGCGLVPRERPDGERYEVRAFDSVRDSVASYMRNLNSHDSYRGLRAQRAELRAQGRPLSGLRLAEGLAAYSEQGDAYVREVQQMIRENALEAEERVVALMGR